MKQAYILVFDVDGTVSPMGRTMARSVSEGLFALEQAGHTICFASGAPCHTLEGLMRGVGLENAFVIGENGAVASTGFAQPPIYRMERPAHFDEMQRDLIARFPGVYFQSNLVDVSAFHEQPGMVDVMVEYLQSRGDMDRDDMTVFVHNDCVECVPAGAGKGAALHRLKEIYGWQTGRMIAVGDGPNDESMRAEVGEFFAIGDKLRGDINFADIDGMMAYMLKRFAASY